jgi:hypothetical protein
MKNLLDVDRMDLLAVLSPGVCSQFSLKGCLAFTLFCAVPVLLTRRPATSADGVLYRVMKFVFMCAVEKTLGTKADGLTRETYKIVNKPTQ